MREDVPPAADGKGGGAGLGADFSQRVASGLVIIALVAILLYLGTLPFGLLIAALAVIASWEWSRLVRGNAVDAAMVLHALAAGVAAGMASLGFAALGLAVIAAGTILAGLLSVGRHPLLSAAGVVYAGLPAVALLWLREDDPHGLASVALLIACVALTDTGAFLAGRAIGGPKLAPRISPNKTWAGLIGGVSASAAAGAAIGLFGGWDPLRLALAGALIAIVSQSGDLMESALKRAFDVKDTSHLIPGHGGVMDRIDGLVFASVAAALYGLAVNPYAPATALLIGP
jgi:phosphatidate cytidylyltransferase